MRYSVRGSPTWSWKGVTQRIFTRDKCRRRGIVVLRHWEGGLQVGGNE